jgi:hypothetical protein
MMRARFASFITLLIGLLLLMPVQTFGQAVFGSIFGTVTDASGAVIPNAKVTVTNVRKGTAVTYDTNESGNYSATHLIPDIYTIKVEANGFTTAQSDNIQVSADTGSKFDAALKTGTQTETVQVTAEAPQLKTDREDVAIEFNQKYVQDLPLFNRNFTSLELASPGTQKLGWSHAATENPQGGQQIFVNGQHFSGTAFELDGTDNQDPILGIIVVNPNLDAVNEAKIATQNYDAEFGKAVAGVVTAQTKSGSNEIHGGVFWFRRTDATQARDPFTQFAPDPVTGRMIPSSRWNQFGASVGGPIIKDKLFFFGDYQGTRQVSGITQKLSVPTSTVLGTCLAATGFCNLSQYQSFIGNGKAGDPTNYIYDPATGDQVTGANRLAFCGASGEVANPTAANCPTPFLVPVGKLSPQALNILKLFPTPSNGSVQNNFTGAGSGPFNQNSFDTRIDYNVSSSIQAFGRYSLDYFNLSGKGALGALGGPGFGLIGLDGESTIHNYSLASGITKTFSPTLLADFRFGYLKYNPEANKLDAGTAPATAFGIPGLNLNQETSGLPYFNMGNASGTGNVISDFGDGLGVGRCNCPLTESEQQFQWVNNWTKIVGNHQYKFGADIRYAENLRVPSDSNRAGQLQFNPLGTSGGTKTLTGGTQVGNGQGGLDLATFLLGNVTQFDRYDSTSINAAERQKRWFFYGQDTWRATQKLTINYGLRWEDYFPESVNGKGNGGFANIQEGVIRVAGFGPYGLNGDIGNATGAFAPRLGLAYQLKQNTVIRMGYGRSYDMGVFGSNFGHTVTQNLPVLVDQQILSANATGNSNTPQQVVPVFLLNQGPPAYPFPTGSKTVTAIPASGQLPLTGFDGTGNPHIRPLTQRLPTLDAWNVTVQRQLNTTMSIDIAYIGNKGTHMFAGNGPTYNVNQPSIVGFTQGVPQAQRRPLFNKFVYSGIPGYVDPTTGQPLVCCSGDLGNYAGNDASNNYNAFQVKVDKRFSHGLQFFSHFTWSHVNNFDNNYYVDDPHVAYGPDDNSRNKVWVSSIVYELPFGRGKAFLGSASKAVDYVVGGWQINSITNWSSGLPFTPSINECGPEEDVGVCRPNVGSGSFPLGGSKLVTPATGSPFVQFFTPAPLGGAFTDPGKGNIGNAGHNSMIGPRYFGTDASLMKNFNITERVKGQFRMDAFNLFNHRVLGFSNAQGGTCVDCVGTNNGQVTDIESDTQMRQLQFAVRFNF